MKCIIFDFDETIFPSRDTARRAMKLAIEELGLQKYNITLINKPLYNPTMLIKLLALEKGIDSEQEKNFLMVYEKYLKKEEENANIDNIIYEMINEIDSKKNILAIFSERNTEGLVNILEKIKLKDKFRSICGRDKMKPKPAIDFIQHLIDSYYIKKQDMIYVGDSDLDYLTAKKEGIYYIHTKYSKELSNLSWKLCDKMVSTPYELKEIIENFLEDGVKNG